MSSALKFTLKWVGLFLLFLAYMYWLFDLEDYDWGPREPRKPTIRDLPLERSDDQLWSPQSAALIEAFSAQKNELEALRKMMAVRGIRAVSLFGDNLLVDTVDGRQLEDQEVDDRDQWLAKMARLNITGIRIDRIEGRFDTTAVFPQSPWTTPDRNETINYLFNHPMPEKECSHELRQIPCGVCDVPMEDNWSVRFEWTSGEFEREYSESFSKLYGNQTSGLTADEIRSKVTKARKECKEKGLQEMGYDDIQTVYLSGGKPALSDEAKALVGEWPLCVDPDGRPQDSLLFESDGSGYVLRRDMPDIEFRYRVEGASLRLLMQTGERAIWIPLKISPGGKKLLMYSDKTKNTSFYVRESEVAEFNCNSE